MMKLFKLYFFACLLPMGLVMGCSDAKQDDDVFETPLEQRLNDQLEFYLDALQSSPEGWRLAYQPNSNALIYHFHLKFNEDLRAEIVSDIGGGTLDLPTTYRVSRAHIPELVIESYSAFHFLFEVGGFSNKAEFEFNFVSVQDDEIVLKSKTDSENSVQTVLTLIRATSSDKQVVLNFQKNLGALRNEIAPPNCFRNIEVKDASDSLLFDGSFQGDSELRTAEICFEDTSGTNNTIQLSFVPTTQGIQAVEPLDVAGQEIKNFIFNSEENTLTSTDAGLQTTIAYSDIASPNACSNYTLLYLEQFTTEIPATWETINASVPLGTDNFVWENNFGGVTLSTWAASTTTAGSQISTWLISPVLQINNGDIITFWTMAYNQNTFADRLELRLSRVGENSILPQINDSQNVGDFTTVLEDINPLEQTNTYSTSWVQIITDPIQGLSGPTPSRLAFRHRVSDALNNGNGVRVDAVGLWSQLCE